MDAWTLALPESLRFWGNSGLRHILCDQDVSAFNVARETRSEVQTVSRSASARPASAPVRPGWKAPAPGAQAGVQPQKREQAAPAKPESKRPESAAPVKPQFEDSGSELSVFPWEAFRPRLRVPCRTVWTYWDLGTDFGANPHAGRRELFKNILEHLHWPGGRVTFWPLNFEHGGGLKAQPGQFWRGVREAKADTVFCFGERAFKVLFPRQTFGRAPVVRGDVTVYPLPGPGVMLGGDVDAKRIVWRALRSHTF